ncbi:hypothetical protein [Methylobacterium sp. 37f]|uniref:hypothetical protein n=1 Tax=Methylobacterium sp. 37f TaxID=2817058 RepID=UPI001FFD6065|nr:hypothetical protein [Methylobacterium sp. 37f]MCK2054968.1 hypothetical protein [Methylobacterium sp. 37f]
MPTIWHKDRWWPGDLVAPFDTPAVWALPLGIYCEDQETFAALRRSAWENEPEMAYAPGGQASIGGIAVFVATPEQAELLRAMPARSPEESLAEQQAEVDLLAAKVDRLQRMLKFGTVPRPGAPTRPFEERRLSTVTNAIVSGVEFMMGRDPAPAPEVRHPFRGANRGQRRAAEAKGRKRA